MDWPAAGHMHDDFAQASLHTSLLCKACTQRGHVLARLTQSGLHEEVGVLLGGGDDVGVGAGGWKVGDSAGVIAGRM